MVQPTGKRRATVLPSPPEAGRARGGFSPLVECECTRGASPACAALRPAQPTLRDWSRPTSPGTGSVVGFDERPPIGLVLQSRITCSWDPQVEPGPVAPRVVLPLAEVVSRHGNLRRFQVEWVRAVSVHVRF